MLHATTWYSEGLCVTYDRLLDIRDAIGEEICKEYDNNDLVCPPLLEEGAFVTAAIDNLDHNPSSVDADTSVHVTTLPALEQNRKKNEPPKKLHRH